MWRAIGTPAAQLSWLLYGFELRFLAPPPMVGFENHPNSFLHAGFIDGELAKRVARGQLSVVPESAAHQIHPMEVVPKASGGFRLIVDCRALNGFLPDVAFKLENLAVIPHVVKRGALMFSTDLEDAYYHVPIHEASRNGRHVEQPSPVCIRLQIDRRHLKRADRIGVATLRAAPALQSRDIHELQRERAFQNGEGQTRVPPPFVRCVSEPIGARSIRFRRRQRL